MNDGGFDPDTQVCHKCYQVCNEKWISGKTYLGIDRHHNPPEFISNFFKENWSGEFYKLCRKCHVSLHKEIKNILFKNSNSASFINSENWLMKKMTIEQIKKAKQEIYIFTKRWIKENDTKTT